MTLPNFLIIGAAKAGTSSLHYYLSQHPQIFMPFLKEPMFFALENEELNFQNPDQGINYSAITNIEDYQKLFEGATEIAVGEVSPIYLYSEKAASRINYYIPTAKLIVVLRNPVDRAFSCYTHLLREDYETLSFSNSLKEEKNRIEKNWAHLWHYKRAGYYYKQLKIYFDIFDSKQIKVLLYDDFEDSPQMFLKSIFAFLEVETEFSPEMTKMNVSGLPKSKLVHDFFRNKNFVRTSIKTLVPGRIRTKVAGKIKMWNLKPKPQISETDRDFLLNEFRCDIEQLQALVNRDLSLWLE